LIFNPRTKQFYSPNNSRTNIFYNLSYCGDCEDFKQKLSKLSGQAIALKSLEDLAEDLEHDRNVIN